MSDERPDRLTPRDDLTGPWRAVSEVLDDYLMREHGRITSHNGWDLFIDLLRAEGYEVRSIDDPS